MLVEETRQQIQALVGVLVGVDAANFDVFLFYRFVVHDCRLHMDWVQERFAFLVLRPVVSGGSLRIDGRLRVDLYLSSLPLLVLLPDVLMQYWAPLVVAELDQVSLNDHPLDVICKLFIDIVVVRDLDKTLFIEVRVLYLHCEFILGARPILGFWLHDWVADTRPVLNFLSQLFVVLRQA